MARSYEYTAQQRAALAVLLLLTQGPQRAHDLGRRLSYSDEDAWKLLDNLAGLSELGLYNDRGWWQVGGNDLRSVREAMTIVEKALGESEGGGYCRPLSRRDMTRIREALKQVETILRPDPVP